MHKICVFLTKLTEMGVLYGNLRPENILIKFDKYKSRIEQVKFIDFGCVTDAENVNSMVLPVRLDHVPPEVLQHFKGNRSFSNNETSKDKIEENEHVGEQFSSPSFDVFSFGVLLLNIIAGKPNQV